MDSEREHWGDAMPCGQCGLLLATRVLADPVTLVVVGACPRHGTQELARVRLHAPGEAARSHERDDAALPYVAPAEQPVRAEVEPARRVAYRPGPACGLRLDGERACGLPPGHGGTHRP